MIESEYITELEGDLIEMRNILGWVLEFVEKPEFFANEGDIQYWNERLDLAYRLLYRPVRQFRKS